MGELIQTTINLRIEASGSDDDARVPGLAWTLSEETLDAIREIDESLRAAEQLSGSLLVG